MADLSKFEDNPQKQLLEEIQGSRCVMMGSPHKGEHMQPMSPQIDDELIESGERVIYFYSDTTSDLGKAVMENPGAVIDAVHIDKDYQASVRGSVFPTKDMALIERFWNPVAASWYPEGKADSKMLMLKFVPTEAAVWASTGNPLKFLYETAKANTTDSTPNLGDHKVINPQAA